MYRLLVVTTLALPIVAWSADEVPPHPKERTLGPGTDGTATLCANGPLVSLFDYLGGSPDLGGTWSGPAAHPGFFDPAADVPGTFTYTVPGPPVESAQVTVIIHALPNAGTNGSLSICSNAPAVDLFTVLGGSPQPSGGWTFGGSPAPNQFTPGISPAGTYTYTVNGTAPCPNATADVVVLTGTSPDAGSDRSITVCSSDAAFSMFTQLSGSPDPGGTWSPGGSDTFTPGTSLPGVYVYVVPSAAPCTNDTAKLTITVRDAPDAGNGTTVEVCSDAAVFNLRDSLSGTPDAAGTWTGPAGAHPGLFQPASDPGGAYVYNVPGQAPCPAAIATVTVTVRPAADAGTGVNVVKCSNGAPFTLISQLGGTPDAGGTWTGPDGSPFPSGTFTPGTSAPGAYTYHVAGVVPCLPASATVNVSVVAAPVAGTSGSHTVCSADGSFALFDHLGGNSDVGGSWTGPSGPVPSGLFVPGTSLPGVYTYLVTGTSPCANATTTVTVSVVGAANAGSNGAVTLCSTGPDEDLFGYLGGTPDPGGQWTIPAPGNGTLAGGLYQPSNAGHPAGGYTYTVTGTAPCPNASAMVVVVENQAPYAGTDAATSLCSTNPAFGMNTLLGGVPDMGGSWLDPTHATVPATFTPGTTPPGSYRYVVTGQLPCMNDTSVLEVNIQTAPKAGTNGAVVVCSDGATMDLFTLLGGTPQGGGTWTDPNNASHSGFFVPGQGAVQGGYTYHVEGVAPCNDAAAVVTVTQHQRPIPGSSTTLNLCTTDPAVNLFVHLGGTPDAGGTWTGPGGTASNGVFIPSVAGNFIYKYKVTGTAPCAPDSATVSITVNQAPNAGTNGNLTICAGQATVDLFTGLEGTPDLNGTWSEITVTGRLSGQFFNAGVPTQLTPGIYDFRYVVVPNGSCAGDTSTVRVTIVPALDAGIDGSLNVCNSATQVDLFNALQGGPQPGGSWEDTDGTGQVTGKYFNAQGAGPGTFHFKYKLTGALGCSSDSAVVTVQVVAGPNAGHEAWATFCSSGPPVGLFPYISPADLGGVWRRPPPGNELFDGTYNPGTFEPGDHTYTVSAVSPCSPVVVVVHVSETPGPDSGQSAVVAKCANDPAFDMTASLGGSPDPGGTWQDPFGQAHTGTFVPGLDPPGVYLYTVAGMFPCTDKTSSLTVNVGLVPQAGGATSRSVCSNAPAFQLITGLPGAQPGGSWFGPLMVPHPSGTYVPGTSVPGLYTYRVTGVAPCGVAEGTVNVSEISAPNAGQDTSVVFCQNESAIQMVNIPGGPNDLTGTWSGPAPSTNYFSGTFLPGTSAPGVYKYKVNGTPPCPADSSLVTVSVFAPPSAGLSRNLNICSSAGLFAMVDSLGGVPDLNGSWVRLPSGNPSNGIFNPANPGVFIFQYTVLPVAGSPCAPAQSTLTITVTAAPQAGDNGNLALCTTSGLAPLYPSLTGGPQSGGTWSFNGVGHGSSFDPSVDQPGPYAYAVQGTGGCLNDTAWVSVQVNQAPNAGSNGVLTLCDDTLAAIILRNVLNGNPAQGGVWTDSQTGLPANDIYVPSSFGPGVHTFTYSVVGQAPCPVATAQATIIQNAHAVAGNDAGITLCSDGSTVDMFTLVGNAADPGGTWIDADGVMASSLFSPASHGQGSFLYRYVVAGDAPCENDTANVDITVNRKPNAGVSTAPQLCSNAPMVALQNLLGGTPDPNGSWTFVPSIGAPIPSDGTFEPGVDPAGAYVYTVAGIFPCTNSAATVQIAVVPAPDAGSYGASSACVSDDAVNLFAALQGEPQTGGTWQDLNATGQLTNAIFDATGVPPGNYRFLYTVAGAGPCANDTASVLVTVSPELDAGTDANTSLCLNQVVALTPLLGGSPQAGGVWTGVDSPNGLINDVLNCAQAGVGVHQYRYVVGGNSTCDPDTAVLTVTIQIGPQAGSGVPASICTSAASFDLFNQLSPPYDTNGQWHYPVTGAVMPSSIINPAVDPAGTYIYSVPAIGNCPAASASVQVSFVAAANAGSSGSLAFCSNQGPGSLIAGLGGGPDLNGTWTFGSPPVLHSPMYDPAVDQGGNYFYTVNGSGPCPNATATVLVAETQAPMAGDDATYTLCSDQGAFNMFTALPTGAEPGGTWRRNGTPPTVHGANYNPAVDSSGVFLYIRLGTGPCANDTARLTVMESRAPQAGSNATLNVCPTDDSVDLFAALGPLADTNGTWYDANNNTLPDSLFNASIVPLGTYFFAYVVQGAAPCVNDTALVTVLVGEGLNAGIGGNDTICGTLTQYDLFGSLGGDPDLGGVWSEQTGVGAITGQWLDASALVPGTAYPMAYTLEDPACGQVQSVVLLYIAPYPDPGPDTSLTVCSTSAPFNLDLLLRNAGPGGQWLDPNGDPTDLLFNPALDLAGTYSYYLAGNATCGDTAAHIALAVNPPANAGADANVQLCNSGITGLFPLLAGVPQPGGDWVDLDGSGVLVDGEVDLSQLAIGTYRFRYVVQWPGCPADSALLTLHLIDGVVVTDLQRTCNELDRTYVVSFTISGGSPASYTVIGGGGTLSPAPPFIFTSSLLFANQAFSFTVDDANHCSPTLVEGTSPCAFTEAVFVPESFTPNGDGTNDRFIIPGIEGYPGNTIAIFNRWGGEVYGASGYDNVGAVWDGSSPKALLPGDAPTGTYYYVLDLGTGTEPLKGYVYLNR